MKSKKIPSDAPTPKGIEWCYDITTNHKNIIS